VFKSLQARLTLSYVVIILVCLVLVGLVAWVLLRGYQANLTYSRLNNYGTLGAGVMAQMLRRGTPPQDAVERLARQINQGVNPPVFVYLLDAEGLVIAGSNPRLRGQRFEELAAQSASPSDRVVRGERRLGAGERLLYVAVRFRAAREEGQPASAHALLLAQSTRPAHLALADLLPRLLWAGAVALFISIILAAVMACSIARPLERVTQAAEEVAAGNYEPDLEASGPEEVARLARSFDSMARQVKATLQSQRDLVANVSHDLKTPLTSIQGFSQALLDGTAGDEEARRRAATIIHEEAGRMRRLVDQLLDLAQLEAGQVALKREPVEMDGLLRACASRFAPQAQEAGVALQVEVEPDLPPILGDADRLEQVFGNLVDNALKHSGLPAGEGRVVLRAGRGEGVVLCSVTDNGRGIPAEELPRVFERFYRLDKSRVQGETGAGLGLAIGRQIVQAHGGRIEVESVEGLGTRFVVELPVQPAVA